MTVTADSEVRRSLALRATFVNRLDSLTVNSWKLSTPGINVKVVLKFPKVVRARFYQRIVIAQVTTEWSYNSKATLNRGYKVNIIN